MFFLQIVFLSIYISVYISIYQYLYIYINIYVYICMYILMYNLYIYIYSSPFYFTYLMLSTILNKCSKQSQEIKQNWTGTEDFDNWMNASAQCLIANTKVNGYSTQFWYFSNISLFSKILNLTLLGNSFGNWCKMFVIVDIKYHFACGESKYFWNFALVLISFQ